MRARLVLALSVIVGFAGVVATDAAAAADLSYHMAMHGTYGGRRAVPTVIESYQPGVTMREYWLPPWRNRHYYPFSQKRSRRVHNEVRRRYRRPQPAQSYHRVWSNAEVFPSDCAPRDQRWLAPSP